MTGPCAAAEASQGTNWVKHQKAHTDRTTVMIVVRAIKMPVNQGIQTRFTPEPPKIIYIGYTKRSLMTRKGPTRLCLLSGILEADVWPSV